MAIRDIPNISDVVVVPKVCRVADSRDLQDFGELTTAFGCCIANEPNGLDWPSRLVRISAERFVREHSELSIAELASAAQSSAIVDSARDKSPKDCDKGVQSRILSPCRSGESANWIRSYLKNPIKFERGF